MTTQISIFNGPNLNLLGQRQPEIYGSDSLHDVEQLCKAMADSIGLQIDFRQTNYEGKLVDWIQEAREASAGIIINPAAYSHTSVAILDALNTFEGPVVEVHISNIHKREEFRHVSYISSGAKGVILGFGLQSYDLAIQSFL